MSGAIEALRDYPRDDKGPWVSWPSVLLGRRV
jgi:hypothetical protein